MLPGGPPPSRPKPIAAQLYGSRGRLAPSLPWGMPGVVVCPSRRGDAAWPRADSVSGGRSLAALHPASVMALKSEPTQRRVRDGAAGGAARISRIKECVRLEGSTVVQPARAGPSQSTAWRPRGSAISPVREAHWRYSVILGCCFCRKTGACVRGGRVAQGSCARNCSAVQPRPGLPAAFPREFPCEPSPATGSSCSGAPG